MRLNYDNVRSVLMILEDLFVMDEDFIMPPLCFTDVREHELSAEINDPELMYAILMLYQAGFITGENMDVGLCYSSVAITSITYTGHQYLDSVRDEKIWSGIKSRVSAMTFDIIISAAKQLISAAVLSQ